MFSKTFDVSFEEAYPVVILAIGLLATTSWDVFAILIYALTLIGAGAYLLSAWSKVLSKCRRWIKDLRDDQTEMITN